MVANLTCVAKSSVNATAIPDFFNTACGLGNGICNGIASNSTTGQYGAYSVCSPLDKLSWAFNAYYQEQLTQNSANTDACDFGGNAQKVTPSAPSGACATLVNQAGGVAGTGTVTSAPSGTGAIGGSGGSSTTTKSAAGAVTVPSFDFGLLTMGVYVVAAAVAGAGMVLL